MRKLIFTGIITLTFLLIMPATALADENVKTVNVAVQAESVVESIKVSIEPYTMYANREGVNIRKSPDTDAEIIDQALLNTSFDVVDDVDGWSMIMGKNGYAYIKSEYLSNTETEIPQYTENDLYILAHVICGEAQGYSDEEQRYVGSVVLNRVDHTEFPDSIEEVVFQKGQYACVSDGNYNREPTERNWANAKWLLENGSVLPENVIWQSGGKQGKGVYLKTKWHIYCF